MIPLVSFYYIVANNTGSLSLVSAEDYDFLNKFNWTENPRGHLVRNDRGKVLMIHRVIAERMGLDLSCMIDHEDRNKLNNQRYNLRRANDSQNQYNSGKQCNNTSGYKGVTWDKHNRRWLSRIRFTDNNGQQRRKHLGSFLSPEAAGEAYAHAANQLHGEFACTH